MRLMELIAEGYREVEQKYVAAGADPQTVKKALDQFRDLVNRNQVQGQERNIDWWGKNIVFDEFSQYVHQKSATPTATQIKRKKVTGRSITLQEDDQWLIVIPLDKDASCFHGKNSDWCTTKPTQSQFEEYFYRKEIILIYCLNKQTGGMWAIAGHHDLPEFEMFDQQDNSIDANEFQRQTGLNPQDLLSLAIKNHQPALAQSREDFRSKDQQLETMMQEFFNSVHFERNSDIEKLLAYLKNNRRSFDYLQSLGEAGVDVNNLPDVIIELAANYSARGTMKYLKNPSPKILETAVADGNIDMFQYIIDEKDIFPLPERVVQSFLNVSNSRDIPEVLRTVKGYNIPITDKMAAKCIKRQIDYVYYFLKDGFSVPEDDQLKFVDYIENNYSWDGSTAKIFKDSSDKVKAAVINYHANAIEYFGDVSEELRVLAYRKSPYTFDHGIWWGNFPSKREQDALLSAGYGAISIQEKVRGTKKDFSNRIRYAKQEIKLLSEKLKKQREKIKYIHDIVSGKSPDLDEFKPEKIEKFKISFGNILKDQEAEYKSIKNDIKHEKYWANEYNRRLKSIERGEKSVGYNDRGMDSDADTLDYGFDPDEEWR